MEENGSCTFWKNLPKMENFDWKYVPFLENFYHFWQYVPAKFDKTGKFWEGRHCFLNILTMAH